MKADNIWATNRKQPGEYKERNHRKADGAACAEECVLLMFTVNRDINGATVDEKGNWDCFCHSYLEGKGSTAVLP